MHLLPMHMVTLMSITAISFLSCSNATGIANNDESSPMIPLGDPLYNLARKLRDELGSNVDTWIIRPNPSIEVDAEQTNVFEGHYQKRNFADLEVEQQELVVARVMESDFEPETYWVEVGDIQEEEDLEQVVEEYKKANPSLTLTYQYDEQPASGSGRMVSIQVIDPEMIGLNVWLQNGTTNYMFLYGPEGAPHETVWAICSQNEVLWWGHADEEEEKWIGGDGFPTLINSDFHLLCGFHANYREMRERRNEEKVQDNDYWKAILMWCSIVGVVAVLVTVLVMCCVFKKYHSDRKKQWENQRERDTASVHVDFDKASAIIDIADPVEARQRTARWCRCCK